VGADQIAAASALDAKDRITSTNRWRLHVILPFDKTSYQATLLDGITSNENALIRFNDLLDRANRVFVLSDASAEVASDEYGHKRYWNSVRFQTLGDILVRQADILLAVWDGTVSTAKGGTSDVVGMALAQGKTVIRIDPTNLVVSCLQSTDIKNDLVRLATSPSWEQDSDVQSLFVEGGLIDLLINKTLSFPRVYLRQQTNAINGQVDTKQDMIFESARAFFGRYPKAKPDMPEDAEDANALLHEDIPLKRLRQFSWFRCWLAGRAYPEKAHPWTYGVVYQWLADRLLISGHSRKIEATPSVANDFASKERFKLRVDYASQDWEKQVGIEESDLTYKAIDKAERIAEPDLNSGVSARPDYLNIADEDVRKYMVAADAIATTRGHAYRSSYVVNFLGGAVAVCVGLVGLFFTNKQYFIGAEILLLLALLGLYVFVRQKCWHKRWLNARHVAESLRANRFLVWLGYGGRRALNQEAPWTAWHTNAVMAASAVPHATVTRSDIRYMTLELRKHVRDQQKYHESNSVKLQKMHHTLDKWGQICVFAAIGVAVIYLSIFHFFDCFGASFCEYQIVEYINSGNQKAIDHDLVKYAKYFVTTFCAAMPVLAGAFMGIRFQGDFERFAERSAETQGQLAVIDRRLYSLLCDIDADPNQQKSDSMPPFERLSSIVLDLLEVYELDLEDWRFVYSARPNPEVG